MTDQDPRVVVGVDGSPDSVRALTWAARLADTLYARTEAITVWEPPIEFGWTYPVGLHTYDWREEAMRTLERTVDDAFGDHRPPRLSLRIAEGYPAAELVKASQGASALVVGSRGRSALSLLLLGSVSTKCAEHAHCPVLVARPDTADVPEPPTPDAGEAAPARPQLVIP